MIYNPNTYILVTDIGFICKKFVSLNSLALI